MTAQQEERNPTEPLVLIPWEFGSSVVHLKLPFGAYIALHPMLPATFYVD